MPSLPCFVSEEKKMGEERRRREVSGERKAGQRRNGWSEVDRFRLSHPGPLYLSFLEMYGRDICYWGEKTLKGSSIVVERDEDLFESEEEARLVKELSSRVGMYCVRPMLRRLTEATEDEGDGDQEEGVDIKKSQKKKMKNKVQLARLLKPFEAGKEKLGRCFGRKKTRLFGEVLSDEKQIMAGRNLNQTKQAMAWYFGETGVLRCPSVESERLGMGKKTILSEQKVCLKFFIL